jgi:hypothetical protein
MAGSQTACRPIGGSTSQATPAVQQMSAPVAEAVVLVVEVAAHADTETNQMLTENS